MVIWYNFAGRREDGLSLLRQRDVMDTRKKIEYWLDIAHYDLVSAKAMLASRRFLYVGFLCHQVAEKCLKAYFWHAQK